MVSSFSNDVSVRHLRCCMSTNFTMGRKSPRLGLPMRTDDSQSASKSTDPSNFVIIEMSFKLFPNVILEMMLQAQTCSFLCMFWASETSCHTEKIFLSISEHLTGLKYRKRCILKSLVTYSSLICNHSDIFVNITERVVSRKKRFSMMSNIHYLGV